MMLHTYYLVVADADGKVVSASVQAYSRGDVVETLRSNNYAILEIMEA